VVSTRIVLCPDGVIAKTTSKNNDASRTQEVLKKEDVANQKKEKKQRYNQMGIFAGGRGSGTPQPECGANDFDHLCPDHAARWSL